MQTWKTISILLLTGLLLRVVGLGSIPPGLWSDEANHGLEANEILAGGRLPIFFPGNCGQEPLFKYLVVGLTALLGPGVMTLRLTAALAGWLLLPLTWWWVRRVRGSEEAAWTLFFLAFGVWHLHFSRIAFRAILGPTVAMGILVLIEWCRAKRSVPAGLAAGAMTGLLWYTYPAFRLFTLISCLWLLLVTWKLASRRRIWASYLLGLFLLLLPLVWAWKDNPELFTARASMAALWGETPDIAAGFFRNLLKHMGMFVVSGDQNWRHNLAGVPQLDLLTGFLFLIGLAVSLGRRKHTDILLVLWLCVMLLPGILSVERQAPHCLRTLGVLPLPYLFAAQGVLWIRERLSAIQLRRLILVLFLTIIPLLNLGRYFVVWPRSLDTLTPAQEALYGFHRQECALARWLAQRSGNERVWLSPQLYLHPTVAYLAGNADYALLKDPMDLQEEDLVVLQLSPRNLWWLRDDFRKNFFRWWWDAGRTTQGNTWEAIGWAYPDCGDGLARISHQHSTTTADMAPPASLRFVGRPRRIAEDTSSNDLGHKPRRQRYLSRFTTKAGEKSGLTRACDSLVENRLHQYYQMRVRGNIWGLTVFGVGQRHERVPDRDPRSLSTWRRVPTGCFAVDIDSLPPGTHQVTLIAREEESPKQWILDTWDATQGNHPALRGCLLFPACVRIETDESSPPAENLQGLWHYRGPADPEPYFRRTLWGRIRARWARFRSRTTL